MKRIFYILTFILIFTSGSFAQKISVNSDPGDKYIKFYPNPVASSVINFEFQKGFDKSFTIQLYNFPGKKVFEIKTTTPKITIPLTDFYRGLYFYRLIDKSGNLIESGKFQVIK